MRVRVIPGFVVGDLSREKVELAAVGLLNGVTVDHVLRMPVNVHLSVDANEFVALSCEGDEIVGTVSAVDGELRLRLEAAVEDLQGLTNDLRATRIASPARRTSYATPRSA